MNDGAGSIGPLRVFRKRFYACLGRRAEALFELCDAIMTADRVPSPPHLSLVSVHRRGWGSLYAALRKGGVDEEGMLNALRNAIFNFHKPQWTVAQAESYLEDCLVSAANEPRKAEVLDQLHWYLEQYKSSRMGHGSYQTQRELIPTPLGSCRSSAIWADSARRFRTVG